MKPSCDTQNSTVGNSLVDDGGLSPQAGCLLDHVPLPTSLGIYIILKSAATGIPGLQEKLSLLFKYTVL